VPVDADVLTAEEAAVARSVLYASLFEYPLTLSQLRQSLIESRQTPSQILAAVRDSGALRRIVEHRNGFFFPRGQAHLIEERRRRESRSRAFLAVHGPLLQVIAALPYVQMVALSGSVAHLNLESGGDLDLFIVTSGRHVWTTAVVAVMASKLLRRRRTLCANFIVADSALAFEQQDLFTANQITGLKPLTGTATYRRLIAANPFVSRLYPNFHPSSVMTLRLRQPAVVRHVRRAAEALLAWPSALVEHACRWGYGTYLRRRAHSWSSPEQVRLEATCLKLHTRSHRGEVMERYSDTVAEQLKIEN
jgi:hypothetical protein